MNSSSQKKEIDELCFDPDHVLEIMIFGLKNNLIIFNRLVDNSIQTLPFKFSDIATAWYREREDLINKIKKIVRIA